MQLKSPSSELCQGDPPFDMLEFIRNYRFVTSFFCLTFGLPQPNNKTFLGQKILTLTENTQFNTLWLFRVCAKTTCLNLMKPFAHKSPLTRVENDAPYNLTIPCFDPEKLK